MTEPLVAIPDSLAHDPQVYAAIKSLTLTAIEQATDILETATLQHRIALIRAILPTASKALAAKTNDEETDEMRKKLTEMYESIGGQIGMEQTA